MIRHHSVATLVTLVGLIGTARANPIFPGADPDAVVIGKAYWLYPTNDKNDTLFKAYSSDDLREWKDRGVVLDFKDVRWINDDGRRHHGAWAPTLLADGGKFYFYYAVGPQTADKPSRIGVAVGDRPEGPFVDSGRPLVTGGNGFEAIDPMAYVDPKTGVAYLYAGGSAGATLRVWELAADRVSLKRQIDVKTPKNFTEGAFMHERDGTYYLSYSHGSYNTSGYSVYYATAPSPTGPWTYRGRILSSDATHQGPGHHSFVRNPATGEWFIVYHRWETTEPKGTYHGSRQVAIERVTYAADGAIEPITMTDESPPLSPIR